MRKYDGSPSYEGQATGNYIKQNCLSHAKVSAHFSFLDNDLF